MSAQSFSGRRSMNSAGQIRISFFLSRTFDDKANGGAWLYGSFRTGFLPKETWLNLVKIRGDNKPLDAPMDSDQYARMRAYVSQEMARSAKEPVLVQDIPHWMQSLMTSSSKTIADTPTCFRYLADLSRTGLNDRANQILPFQLDGLRFGVAKEGRCLIADEMGLGKTLQALMIAYEYSSSDWPLLIVCPSSIRFVWKQQISKWLDGIINTSKQVQVIAKGKETINPSAKIIIVPYILLATNPHLQALPNKKPFQCVICDESHYIKESKSKRSVAVGSILKKSRRAILLSGTPSMNNADELYHQIIHLFPKGSSGGLTPPTLAEFRYRYCIASTFTPKHSSFPITRWSGSQFREELNSFLLSTIMIRRMKKDVLTQLPDKIRQRIDLDVPEDNLWCSELQKMTAKWLSPSSVPSSSSNMLETMELWRATGAAKLPAMKEYLKDLFSSNESSENFKCIIFAHHKFVLDGLEDMLLNECGLFVGPGKYMRIDGSVSQNLRAIAVSDFQSNPSCKVALLSITACAEGITLTAANLVVFGELYWVPGVMEQAEARAHRVGQKDSVFCQYLILPHSPDQVVFNMLEQKKKDTSAILDGVESGLVAESSAQELAELLSDDSCWISEPGEIQVVKKFKL